MLVSAWGWETGRKKRKIILWVIVLGLLSNAIGDGGYIILLPIAAMLFQWVGLHPIAGIVTAYVSVACGYSANIVLSTMDPLLAHTTQEAALAQTGYQGNTEPLCNYFFYECFNGAHYGYCVLDYSKNGFFLR